jgi:hypothetical protein
MKSVSSVVQVSPHPGTPALSHPMGEGEHPPSYGQSRTPPTDQGTTKFQISLARIKIKKSVACSLFSFALFLKQYALT